MLIEEVGEQLDPSLDPLLSRSIQKQGGVEMIQLGDGMVNYFLRFSYVDYTFEWISKILG